MLFLPQQTEHSRIIFVTSRPSLSPDFVIWRTVCCYFSDAVLTVTRIVIRHGISHAHTQTLLRLVAF